MKENNAGYNAWWSTCSTRHISHMYQKKRGGAGAPPRIFLVCLVLMVEVSCVGEDHRQA
jgi:hypothetical protein